MRGVRARALAFFAAAVVLIIPIAARAQTCTFTIDTLDFGEIDVTQNMQFTANGTYRAECFALLSATRTCPNIGVGTGGSSSGSPRYMQGPGGALHFDLIDNTSTLWGSHFWGFPGIPPPTDIQVIILGEGNITRQITARIPAGQQTLPAGVYTSSFAGSHTRVTYAAYLLGLFPPDCATMSIPFGTAPFTVRATIKPSCTVTATTLDFGSSGFLEVNRDNTNELHVTCTSLTPYSISLDGGNSHAVDPTQRRMTKGSEHVTYGLYRDAARVLPWGSSIGTNTVSDVGSGLQQSHTVYGRVPPQTTPSAGTYTDTIIVTVTY